MKKQKTDVYRHYDKDGILLYVGISLSTLSRLSQHKEISSWYHKIVTIKIEKFESRYEALKAEEEAIIMERPIHNIMHSGKQISEELLIQITKINDKPEDSRLFLADKIVSYKPLYTLEELKHEIGFTVKRLKQYIEDGILGAIVVRKTWNKHYEKEVLKYGITGWQVIDFIEYLQTMKEVPDSRLETKDINDKQ